MRMRSLFLIITILILTSLTGREAFAAMQVLFPVDDSIKSIAHLHIICRFDNSAPAVVSINGSNSEKKLIRAKDKSGVDYYMLMTIQRLEYGDNSITVSQGDNSASFNITRVSDPASISDWTEKLSDFHTSGTKDICTDCHRFDNLSDCVNCHKDKFKGPWVHKPVKQAKCFECHEKDNGFIFQEPFMDTCLKCHEGLKTNLEKSSYVHGPVASEFCTVCHSPHKSTDKTHLRKPVNSLCVECHDTGDLYNGIHSNSYIKFHPVDQVFIEKLNKKIECSDCHNPHYSENPMMLSVENDAEELCVKCHDAEDAKELLKVLMDEYEAE